MNPDYYCNLAVLRSLGKKNIKVIVGNTNPTGICNFSKYKYKQLSAPRDSKKLLNWLISNKDEFDTIFPDSDQTLWLLNENRKILSKHFKLMLPSCSAILDCLLKDRTYKRLKQLKHPCLKIYERNKVKFPVVAKPRSNIIKNPAKGKVIYCEKDLEGIPDDYILQEYIPNPKIIQVAGYISSDYKPIFCTVTEKIRQIPPKLGIGVYAKIIQNKKVVKQTFDFLKAIKYHGLFEFEYIFHNNKYYLIDVACRGNGLINLEIKSGCDVPYAWYSDLSAGLNQNFKINSSKKHFLNFYRDLLMVPYYLLHRKKINYLDTFKQDLVFAVFDKKDMLPFFVDLLNNTISLLTRAPRYIRYISKGE